MSHNTKIGKNILEMLMFSLYPEAETIYREYLQNACDSINEAVKIGLLSSKDQGHVSIEIDRNHQQITISDNGIGIPAAEAEARLKDIACSQKDESFAGFYGIGRLVGAGYCKQLSFKTSAHGEEEASEIVFDVEKIRDIIKDSTNEDSASEVIDKVTTTKRSPEVAEKHYFEVTLSDILPDYPDLLDDLLIYKYLRQVAPIPYSPEFKNTLMEPNLNATENRMYLDYYNQMNSYNVTINDHVDIRKKYGLTIDGTNDEIGKIQFFLLQDPKFGILAWGWYAITPFDRAIPDTDPNTSQPVITRGIRLRIHNIQVGTASYFDGTSYFKQARSNKYFNGEIHVVHPKIKPTTDRSDLAPSPEALKLKELIKELFNNDLQKVYQEANKLKNQVKKYQDAEFNLHETRKTTAELFSNADKEKEIKDKEQEVQDAKSDCEKYFEATGSSSLNTMRDLYKKKFDKIQEDASTGTIKPTKSESPIKKKQPSQYQLDTKKEELILRYGKEKYDMLATVFNIIDSQFKDFNNTYQQAIKSIQIAVVKYLMEQ